MKLCRWLLPRWPVDKKGSRGTTSHFPLPGEAQSFVCNVSITTSTVYGTGNV